MRPVIHTGAPRVDRDGGSQREGNEACSGKGNGLRREQRNTGGGYRAEDEQYAKPRTGIPQFGGAMT